MENNVNTEKSFPFFKIIYGNLLFIVLLTILCGLLGVGAAVMKDKTVYTASCSAVFRASITGSQNVGSDAQNTASLGKLYMPMVKDAMTSPAFIEAANKELNKKAGYENASISTGNLAIKIQDESLIFNIAYNDLDKEAATVKVQTIFNLAKTELAEYFPAKDVSITSTNRNLAISQSNGFAQYVIIGVAIGVVLGVFLSILKYTLDNTVRDKDELEQITGVTLIAFIEKDNK